MNINEIRDKRGARKPSRRVGRGPGSGRGCRSGRGDKGQLSRSGASGVRAFEGGQMPIFRRLPKRGFNNTIFTKHREVVNLGGLQRLVDRGLIRSGDQIDPEGMRRLGLVRDNGREVKLLAKGELKVPVSVRVHQASASAVAALEKLGAKAELISDG